MRFGIKSLLVLVALATVLVAFVVEPYLRAERVRVAIELLTSSSENVIRDEAGKVAGLTCSPDEYGKAVDNKEIPLDRIVVLPELKELHIRNCSFKSLAPIAKLAELHSLTILDCEFKQSASSVSLPIKSLWLAGDQDIGQLPEMPELVELRIGALGSTYAVLVPGVSRTDWTLPNGFDFSSLQRFGQLQKVTLVQKEIKGFAGIENLKHLKTLDLRDTEIYSIQGIENAKHLKSLTLGSCHMLGRMVSDDINVAIGISNSFGSFEPDSPWPWPDFILNRIADALPDCEINGKVGPR